MRDFKGQMSEVRYPMSDVGGLKDRGQGSGIGGQMSETRE